MAETPIDAILSDETGGVGDDVLEHNLAAVRRLTSRVRSTLGPNGNDKIIEQPDGTLLITKSTSTILDETGVTHPASELAVNAVQTVDDAVGDGTTSTLVLVDALLAEAESLRERGLHPKTIVRGYRRADRLAQQAIGEIAVTFDHGDRKILERVAETALNASGAEMNRAALVETVVEAVERAEMGANRNRESIKIETQSGRPLEESTVVDGVVLDEDPVRQAMPDAISDARILLTSDFLELTDADFETTIDIESTEKYREFLEQEREHVREMFDLLDGAGVDVILCGGSIGDELQSKLSTADVLAVRQIEADMEFVSAALDATVVSAIDDLSPDHLGHGDVRRDDADELFVLEQPDNEYVTILLRAPTEYFADDLADVTDTVLALFRDAAEEREVVYGGGATEIELARRLEGQSKGIDGREQLAVRAVADALETVPKLLANSAGRDPIEAITQIRAAHETGDAATGIDAESGEVTDAAEQGLLEPATVKRQAITSAIEATNRVLEIDGVFTVSELSVNGDDQE